MNKVRKSKKIRYSKNNGALYIGGRDYYLAIFTRDKCARLHLGQYRNPMHFGKW